MPTNKIKVLCPLKRRKIINRIIGFDVETVTDKNKFYCCSFYLSDEEKYIFYSLKRARDFFKLRKNRDTLFISTNLEFDFFTLFNPDSYNISEFRMVRPKGRLISLKTYVVKNKFSYNGKYKIEFADTMNFAPFSVEKMGEILKIPKLKYPKCLGRKPINKEEKDELELYNIQDSKISKKFADLFNDGTMKKTISSTSMTDFRLNYLKDKYFVQSKEDLLFIQHSYRGGRVETFARGKIENMFYYDVNSLYPYCMKEFSYPNPNTRRITTSNVLTYIKLYDGVSDVTFTTPRELNYPLLSVTMDNKAIYPLGEGFRGVYTHVELRKALDLGYTITKVFKTIYYKENIRIFKEFIEDKYKKRLEYQKDKNPLEIVEKLKMNSFYGKFGQRWDNMKFLKPMPTEYKDVKDLLIMERLGNFMICEDKEKEEPTSFTMPIWSTYVTAYARCYMYDLIVLSNAVYTDTDSIITKNIIPTSKEMGKLKQEYYIKEGVLIKPKVYYFTDNENPNVPVVKCKGLPLAKDNKFNRFKIPKDEFIKTIENNEVNHEFKYYKFVRLGESLRRNMTVNEIIPYSKTLDKEDNKRGWSGTKFNPNELQYSKPLSFFKDLEPEDNLENEVIYTT